MGFKETIIIKLGGSLIVPNGGIDTKFLKEFDQFIRRQIADHGRRFFIVAGGGSTARHYRDAGAEVAGKITKDDLDWLGIHATRINAHLVRTIFKDIAHPRIIDQYARFALDMDEPVVVAAGWKPGWSSDYDAVLLAKMYGARTLLKMGNISMVYTKDPRKHKDAVPIEKTTWTYYREMAGNKWSPGMNIPIDPVAAQEAEKIDLTVIVLKGTDLDNLENLLSGKPFKGTVIASFKPDASFYDREYFEEGVGYKGYTTSLWGRLSANITNFYRALLIKLFLNPKTLLDVGCATGLLVKYLRKMGVEARGVEISKYALSRADNEIRPYLKYGNIVNLPHKKNEFEVVVTFDVLEHLETKRLEKAVKECCRVAERYCLHKIFTSENWWMKKFHKGDLSQVSVFNKTWWKNFFEKWGLSFANKFFPSLSDGIETIFLIERSS